MMQHSSNNSIQDSTNRIVSIFEAEFNAKEARINELEKRLRELVKLERNRNEKIQNYIDDFGIEKELLSRLISEYLKYVNLDKKDSKSDDDFLKVRFLQEIYLKTMKELEDKLDDKNKNKLLRVLEDCKKNFSNKESEIKEIAEELTIDIKDINDKVSKLLILKSNQENSVYNYYFNKAKQITNNIQSIVDCNGLEINGDFSPHLKSGNEELICQIQQTSI